MQQLACARDGRAGGRPHYAGRRATPSKAAAAERCIGGAINARGTVFRAAALAQCSGVGTAGSWWLATHATQGDAISRVSGCNCHMPCWMVAAAAAFPASRRAVPVARGDARPGRSRRGGGARGRKASECACVLTLIYREVSSLAA